MQKIIIETIKMGDKSLGLLQIKQRTNQRDIVINIEVIDGADEIDTQTLVENIKNEYLKYYNRVSEYM